MAQVGKQQTAPYVQQKTDLHTKEEVNAEDRKRFQFVKGIVEQVESRAMFTRDSRNPLLAHVPADVSAIRWSTSYWLL